MPGAPRIHPTAVVSPQAQFADGVEVGPFVVIEGAVRLGPRTVVRPHAHLIGPLTLGSDNDVGTGAVLGDRPQHLLYKDQPTSTEIGDHNVFREHVTVHRGYAGATVIGSHNYLMAAAHVGHDVRIGNHCILANGALCGGHAEVGDRVLLSGNSAIHQWVKVGRLALLSGVSASTVDVPPFFMQSRMNRVVGINVVGMRRAGIASSDVLAVRNAFRILYRQGLTLGVGLQRAEAELGHNPLVREMIDFIRSSKRGICGPHRFDGRHEDQAA